MSKGYYYSIDAILAATLLLIGLLVASSNYVQEPQTTSIEFYSQDAINILSIVRLSELNSSYVNQLIASGQISDANKTVLAQAAQFWAEGSPELAAQLLNLTAGVVPEQFSVGVFFGNELVYGSNVTAPSNLVSSKQLISGIQKGSPVEGFVSGAQLTSFTARKDNSYYYFGGFVGQGNLSVRMDLPLSANVTSAYLELDASDNFTLYINDNFAGDYVKASAGGGYRRADKWELNSSYVAHFKPGANLINLSFSNSAGFVGGGFLKAAYFTSAGPVSFFSGTESQRYYFPGIRGSVNLYDSFFIPGQLESMFVRLHFDANASTFFTVGNTTLWTLEMPGEQIINLPDSDLRLQLEYDDMGRRTVPLRFGASAGGDNISTGGGEGTEDVILVNDLSGSMEWCAGSPCETSALGPERYCGTSANYKPEVGAYCNLSTESYFLPDFGAVCSARWHAFCQSNDSRKIDIAVNATNAFTSILLGSGNRMGIVGYSNSWPYVIPEGGSWTDRFAPFPDGIVSTQNLTQNITQLQTHADTYMDAYWGTCICCGVVRAREMLAGAGDSRAMSMVLMSDGEATDKCTGVGTGNAKADAVKAAQDSCSDFNISVSTVAFGSDADQETLQDMVCNGGAFYNATDVDELIATYEEIASKIKSVSFEKQLINVTGNASAEGILFGDSYIEYNYTPYIPAEFGVIPAALESPRFGNILSDIALTLPDLTLSEARVTSYSADTWTDNLTISNAAAFSLSAITNDYLAVGDPFVVYADSGLFAQGDNLVHVSTGISPSNSTGGSEDNVIIYTLLVPNSVPEAGVFSKADGCRWSIEFEDLTQAAIAVPDGYSGSEECSFSSAAYPADDAVDDAVFRLLTALDFDSDGLLDVKFEPGNLDVSTNTIQNVPSLWGPTVVEVRVWQ